MAVTTVTPGTLPVVNVSGDTLPEVWEAALVAVWDHGAAIPTQYDKPGDPPSKDATAILTIHHPLQEPRIHRAFPGGIEDLEIYRQEVVDGIHDHWIDPKAGKWEYTYHERLFAYSYASFGDPNKSHFDPKSGNRYPDPMGTKRIDQIQYVVDALVEAPHTRRAQAITWKPWEDCGISDPACLQSLWFRIFDDELVMNVRMRSNDLFKASFMNLYSFVDIQRLVAEKVSEKLGREIKVGQVNHFVDSLHLYGSYFDEIESFLKTLETRTFEQRTYRSDDPMIQEIVAEAREKIRASLEEEKRTGRKGV